MPSPAPTERSHARFFVVAAAVLGTVAGASVAMWLRFDRSWVAREIVAAGLFGAALLLTTVGVRLQAQRRWQRLAEQVTRPVAAGYVGALVAQAEAAMRFVGADGAAIVWTDGAPSVAAAAGGVPKGWGVGATVTVPVGRGWGGHGPAVAARALRHGGARAAAVVVWSSRPTLRALVRLSSAVRAGATAIERARLDDAERRSSLGASHARRQLALLLSASATLAQAIDDWGPAFDALAAEIVPEHADFFAIDLIGADGGELGDTAHDAGGTHGTTGAGEGGLSRVVWADARRAPTGALSPAWREETAAIMAAGRPALLRKGHDASAQRTDLGLDSLAIIPVQVHGAVCGAISVGTRVPRRGLRPSDVEAYEELASRCSRALERVRLYRQTQSAARAAQVNAARVQALFEASPLAIVEVDPSGELSSANVAAVSLFRWARPPRPRVLPHEVAGALPALRGRLAAGQTVVADRVQVRWEDGSGSSLSVAAAIVPRGGLVCIFTDITQRELLEREVQQKQRMEALGRMAGGVAHDFNNLLTVIVGYSDLLAARLGPDDPSYADVDAIRMAGQHAAAFTEQLLTISNSRRVELHSVDLTDAVRALEPVLRRLVGDDIALVIDAERGAWIEIDEGQLEQVLLNLVVNARDAMPNGGVVAITAGGATGPDGAPAVELIVRDSGTGMDAGTLERCFDPFFTTKGRGKGTGLGLATVYGIVDHAGGEITAESTVGAGTTFRATFPAGRPTAPTVAPRPNGAAERGGGGRTVLLVEDEPDVRAYTRTVLAGAGYTVVEAAGAAAALAVVGALASPPALLVTDVLMPGMAGPELVAALSAAGADVPVLFVSGYIEDVRRDELLRGTPSSRFLAKPFTPSALLAAVGDVLDAAAAQPSA